MKQQSEIIQRMKAIPEQIGRVFESQDQATCWSRRLTVSGYPAKRRGRCVWLSTENLQTAAVEMVIRFGFEEFANTG
jgi:hypothetical protein